MIAKARYKREGGDLQGGSHVADASAKREIADVNEPENG
jgi:hypothetical protein